MEDVSAISYMAPRVATAQVVWCDERLLKRDFAEKFDARDVESWALNFAHIIPMQTTQNTTNNSIRLSSKDPKRKIYPDAIDEKEIPQRNRMILALDSSIWPLQKQIAYRMVPNGEEVDDRFAFGRSHIQPLPSDVETTETSALMDAKGVGTFSPTPQNHADGLLSLGEAVRELLMQRLLAAVFAREEARSLACSETAALVPTTVGIYCLIDWGFDQISDGSRRRAGLILRQAHDRLPHPVPTYSIDDYKTRIKAWKVLLGDIFKMPFRKYGLHGFLNPEGRDHSIVSNLQYTFDDQEPAIWDFGSIGVVPAAMYQGSLEEKKLRIPPEVWGPGSDSDPDVLFDLPSQRAYAAAQELTNLPTYAQRQALIDRLLQEMLAAVVDRAGW